jgi:hypothetical protein
MYLSISKQPIGFQIPLAFYFGFNRERVKRHFPISNVSMGKIMLHCEQLAARELQVD